MNRFLAFYIAAALVLFPLDMLWLGVLARDFYKSQLGDLLLPRPSLPVAITFYALYLVGVVAFVMVPAAQADSVWLSALWRGALLGLVAYATYDLTNLATMRGFPAQLAMVDMAWGAVLTALSASAGLALAGLFTDLR